MSRSSFEWDGTEGEAKTFTLLPVGPVATKFLNDKKSTTAIMGPYGSGKTTTCFQKILQATLWQRPGPDGVRRSRGMVVRSTYGQLETNVMADWFEWFPKTEDNWNDKQKQHSLRIDMPRVGELWIEVMFRAVDQVDKPEQLFKGANLTWAWLNEVDTLLPSIRRFLQPRLGRYPGKKHGGCEWFGLWADMNAPDIDNYTYDWLVNQNMGMTEDFEAILRAKLGNRFGIGFHEQPSGLSPEAENIQNLPDGYYEGLAAEMTDNDTRRFVHNEFGAVRKGQPVYGDHYIDTFHANGGELAALPGVPAVLAFDGGSTPAAVLLQLDPDTDQIRVIDEIVIFADDDDTELEKMGAAAFAEHVKQHLDRFWPKLKIAKPLVCDPAIEDDVHGEKWAWSTSFAKELKMRIKAAPGTFGNRISPRLEAVRKRLKQHAGARPGIIFSSRAKVLRQGFIGGYVFTRVRSSSGGGYWRDIPDKSDFSHVHDALQYGLLWIDKKGVANDDADREARAKKKRPKVNYSGYSAAAA